MKKLAALAFRQRVPSFAIVSLSRCGSTALYRALVESSRVRVAYEPDFADQWSSRATLEQFCRRLFSRVSGIKHVWDPNGWPYTGVHRSTPNTLARSDEWVEVNATLLNCVDRVVLLRRRDRLARVISDQLGQQTDLWGHNTSAPQSGREVTDYREQLRAREIQSIDEQIIDWYLRNASHWEDRIISGVPDDRKLTVFYEDLFGPEVGLAERLTKVVQIADWLGVRMRAADDKVRAILEPASKLNDANSFKRIPNFRDIVARFGEVES